MHYPYDAFLRKSGLSIKFFRLEWRTTLFNRSISRWKFLCSNILSKSFDIGVYVTLLLLPLVIIGLIFSVLHTPNKSRQGILENMKVEIALPFITLPIEEIPFYIVALAVNSIVHEIGHSIAANIEDVQTRCFGVHLLFMLPFAYVEIDAEQMSCLNVWKKLKILCAGIWHNIILGMICYLLLISVPQLATSFYNINDSVIVTSIRARSPVASGPKGLHNHDIINSINDCKVTNIRTWYKCLQETAQYQPSFCLTTDFVQNNDESGALIHNQQLIECCDPHNQKVNCFEHIVESLDDDVEVPQYLCLDIRKTIEHSLGYCNKKQHCQDSLCFKPILDNSTTILQIKRWYQEDMLYIGHPSDFSKTVKVSEFVPKTSWLSAHIADNISLFLRYLIVFAFGLALLNIVPCFGFDGQYLISTLLNNFSKNQNKMRRDLIGLAINASGTLLIFILVTKAIWTSVITKII